VGQLDVADQALMKRCIGLLALVLVLVLFPAPARAHVGSPDVYFEGAAGPYRVLVTVQPPEVIPGVAEIRARATTPLDGMTLVPLPAKGDGARFAPTADVGTRDRDDPQTFTAHLWMMSAGPWQVRIHATGTAGSGDLAVPVPALPQRTAGMERTLGAILIALMLLLTFGAVSIVGAGAREGELAPGVEPDRAARRRAARAMAATLALVIAAVIGGNAWWNAEAADYGRYVYKPLELGPTVEGNQLKLAITDPGWLRARRTDDFVPDHGHLMHLFVVHVPEMDRIWHLHPTASASGFRQALPDMPSGRYQLFADVVHADSLAETMVAELTLANDIHGAALDGDDSSGAAPPWSAFDPTRNESPLSDGGKLVWLREGPLKARQVSHFRFRALGADGQPARDLELYMGMLGHAAFINSDRSVFAHVHPTGSVPMAAVQALTNDPHAGHEMHDAALPSEIAFPYGFPKPGDYRIFVQLKRAGKVDTGIFDARVE
jgi:hypothetical protein